MRKRIGILCAAGIVMAAVGIPSAVAGGGCYPNPDLEMVSSTESSVTIGECAFLETVVFIEPGEEVRWENKDPVPHTVSGAAYSWGSDKYLDQGESAAYTFDEEGVYPYYCALHPTMVGAVVVGDATKAATLTGGMAAVAAGSVAADEPGPATKQTDTSTFAAIGLAIVSMLGLVVLAARTLALKRRASAAPVP